MRQLNLRTIRPAGMAQIWMVISFTALMMFASMGVDFSRVQMAKTELQCAADAAARAAATGLSTSTSQARSAGIAVAGLNSVDGSAVVLTNSNIEVGNWASGTFTANGTPSNAVRVTAERTAAGGNAIPLVFATILGVRGCDVHAYSIATVTSAGSGTYGVVGLNGVTLSGSALIDSYSSAVGSYSTGARTGNGDTATNAAITMSGSAKIYGDGNYTTAYNHSGSSGVVAPGTAVALSSALSYASPTLPGSYTNMGTFSSLGYGSTTLSAGNYFYNSFTLNGSHVINTSGTVNIYVNGNMTIAGATGILASSPGNVRVYLMGASTLSIGGSGTLAANVYAPTGTLDISGSSYLLGSAVAYSVTLAGSAAIHVDDAITGSGGGSGSGSGTITTVR